MTCNPLTIKSLIPVSRKAEISVSLRPSIHDEPRTNELPISGHERASPTEQRTTSDARRTLKALPYQKHHAMPRLISLILTCTAAFASDGWIRVGPFGGGAEIIRVSASKPDMLLAATRSGMIFQSLDRGVHWQIASAPPSLGCRIHALAIDPLRDNFWYAGFECEPSSLSGLYRTGDGGVTWDSVPDLRGDVVWSIALSKTGDKIAVGMADGVFLSVDQEHWSRISPIENNDLKPVVSLNFDRQDGQILYAGTTHLPWKTPDLGKTWESIHGGMHDDSDVFSIEPDWRSNTRVFASACSGAYLSENRGTSWVRLPTPPGAFRAYFVAVDPHNTGTVFVRRSHPKR
jgi:hypothetical protein